MLRNTEEKSCSTCTETLILKKAKSRIHIFFVKLNTSLPTISPRFIACLCSDISGLWLLNGLGYRLQMVNLFCLHTRFAPTADELRHFLFTNKTAVFDFSRINEKFEKIQIIR